MSQPFWTGVKSFPDTGWLIEYKLGDTVLGEVMWFGIESDPAAAEHFYPHIHNRRFGSFGSLADAKERVEKRALVPAGKDRRS